MRDLLSFLACLLLVLTTSVGTAHAARVSCCPEMSQAAQTGMVCDEQRGPADTEKRCPQCSAACQGHQVSMPAGSDVPTATISPLRTFSIQTAHAPAHHTPDQALRPPQA